MILMIVMKLLIGHLFKKVEKFIAWKKRGLKEFADLIEEEKDNATLPFPNPNTSRQLGFFTD